MKNIVRAKQQQGGPRCSHAAPALPRPHSSRYASLSGCYGVTENRPEIDALTQYLHEHGLADRKVAVEELFHAATFDIAKV
jgi:hypothetical protein